MYQIQYQENTKPCITNQPANQANQNQPIMSNKKKKKIPQIITW